MYTIIISVHIFIFKNLNLISVIKKSLSIRIFYYFDNFVISLFDYLFFFNLKSLLLN